MREEQAEAVLDTPADNQAGVARNLICGQNVELGESCQTSIFEGVISLVTCTKNVMGAPYE